MRPFFYSQYFAGQKTLIRIRNYLGSSRTSLNLCPPAIILIHRLTSVNFSFPWKKIFLNNFPLIFSEQIFHESFRKKFPWIFYSDFILPELSRFCHNYIVDLYREISISVIKKKLSLANLRSTYGFFCFTCSVFPSRRSFAREKNWENPVCQSHHVHHRCTCTTYVPHAHTHRRIIKRWKVEKKNEKKSENIYWNTRFERGFENEKETLSFHVFFYSLCGFQDDFWTLLYICRLSNVFTDQFWCSVRDWIYIAIEYKIDNNNIDRMKTRKITLHEDTTYFYKNCNTVRSEREREREVWYIYNTM